MTLVINHIEIENFKSYFGKNILGPFHQSFNAVIGPNGSGKSNVIDSLLFVFGFRAQKIRTKRINVLIHNSDQHPNVNSCSVTIYFRKIKETDSNKFEVIPGSEFTVKRTAYKDNSSEYHIDDRKVTHKEVGTLLRDCGVDLDHNRFLILQGEVEQISLLKPKASNEHEEGLLEYLEDIIGTIKYKPLLEEVSQEIDKVNEIRVEKANRVENLRKDKENLEGPKNEAIKYLKLENKLIESKNLYYQVKLNTIQEVVDEQKEGFEELEKQFNELNAKLDEFKKENDTQSTECSLKKKDYEKKNKISEKLKKKLEDLEKEEVEIKEGIKHAKENAKKLEKNVENEAEKVRKLALVPEQNEQRIEELKAELVDLESELEPANKLLQTKMDQVNVETMKYQEKKNALQDKLNELQTAANEAKSKMDIAQSELDVFLNSQNYEKNKLEDTKKKLDEFAALAVERQNGIEELEKEKLLSLQEEMQKANEELNELNLKEKKLYDSVNKSRMKCSEAQSSFSANRNRNKVLSFLMQLKSEGKVPGLFGRLGDLGAIDEKYDVAISTACGSLDCVVVDTIETAQKCVEFLKNNNVGSATFIALDKQDKWKEQVKNRPNTPENVHRLVDLIQVKEEKFLTAFYYSLRNTLVANDLEQATRIAYGTPRYRVVTLKGEVIEMSGTMSGGGQPQRGRMGSRIVEEFSADKIKKLQDTLRDDETAFKQTVERKRQVEPACHNLKTQMDKAKETLAKWKNELGSLKDQIKEYKKFEIACVKKIKEIVTDEAAQRRLEQALEAYKSQFEKADALAAKLRDENDQLHKKIVDISKKILDEPKANLKTIETKIGEANKEMTSLAVEIKTSKRNLITSEKKLASFKQDLEDYEAKVGKFQERTETIDDDLKQAKEQYDAVKLECDESEAEMKELVKHMKQLESKIQKLETEKIDLKHNIENSGSKLKQEEHQLKHYEGLLDSLKLHNIKELENMNLESTENNDMTKANGGYELRKLDQDDLTGLEVEDLRKEVHKLEENLKNSNANLAAIQSYKELNAKFMERMAELEQIDQQRDQLTEKYEELGKKRLEEFMSGFTQIRLKLKEIYRTVTLEGDAELELVDSLDPFTEGIVLSVRPPKKSWKNVSNLSGGEKTLSSLSLVFALHEFRATPIYVMDEIDAALDFKNVSIIAHYIKERTKNAQFIIISLRNNMFELCDRLFGIYKVRNCTSAAFISPELMETDEKKLNNKV